MLRREGLQPQSLSVQELVAAADLGVALEVLDGGAGLGKTIRSPRIQNLGLALAGIPQFIDPGRIQHFGANEARYLCLLDPAGRSNAISALYPYEICCIVITDGLEAPEGMHQLAGERHTSLLRTGVSGCAAAQQLTAFMEARLTPVTTIHGVFVEIFGLGVLLLGSSGIGKSECALELVLRGHRLIADDSVILAQRGSGELIGAAGPILKHYMEVRGIGIIDIRELFGNSAVSDRHSVDFAIRLEKWKPEGEYDRLGLELRALEILGVAVPVLDVPVAPGRNISTLVEVAARTHLLRRQGRQIAREIATIP